MVLMLAETDTRSSSEPGRPGREIAMSAFRIEDSFSEGVVYPGRAITLAGLLLGLALILSSI